tara:strand:+ start:725 stop:1030 length:306 start_codon:yes stop_codon:yes gene_type:complete
LLPWSSRSTQAYQTADLNRCSVRDRFPRSQQHADHGEILRVNIIDFQMTTEHRNWAVVASAMEAQGATSSEMYRRAKAMADGQKDPKPTSFPAAPASISAV